MTDLEYLTLQNAALLSVVRALVKTHPEPERLQAIVRSKAASYQASALAKAPQEYRDQFRAITSLLLEGPDHQDQQG
jgi:hypothetical protein